MTAKKSQKEQIRAAMAEFAAAYQNGQREKMAAFLTPEARLLVHDAKGTREIVGAAAASRSLEGLSGHTQARFGEAKIQLRAGGEAFVEAKLERYEAADVAKYATQAHAGLSAKAHAAHAATLHAYAAQAAQADGAHTMQAHEAQTGAAGMISAEFERHGEQWRVKAMQYTAE